MDEGYYQIAKYLSNAWVDPLMKLSVDYTRAFLGSGIDTYSAAYPFESVYTSEKRLLMSDARDEVLAIYRSCGLEKSESWTVGEDHVAVELEFMGVLAHRAAKALRAGDEERAFSLINTQRNFMDDHLASWVPVFLSDTRRFADTTFYQGVANVTEGFLEEDAALLCRSGSSLSLKGGRDHGPVALRLCSRSALRRGARRMRQDPTACGGRPGSFGPRRAAARNHPVRRHPRCGLRPRAAP